MYATCKDQGVQFICIRIGKDWLFMLYTNIETYWNLIVQHDVYC